MTGRQSETRQEFPLEWQLDRTDSQANYGRLRYQINARLDFNAIAEHLPETDEILDLAIEVDVEGSPIRRRIGFELPPGLEAHHLRSARSVVGDDVYLFTPYLTFRNKRITYRIERFAATDYTFMRRAQKFSWAFPFIKLFTRIWLVGEMPNKAQDNGFHFFRYLRQYHPHRRVYYVIDKNSPDRPKVEQYGNVIERFSRRHIAYSFLASRLVGSHHAEHLFASRDPAVARRTRGVRIFMQHGVTAMKNVVPNYGRQGTWERPTERFIVCSELEKSIVTEDFGYAPRQVPVAGFARFDTLFAVTQNHPPDKTILVMPTWRDNLVRTEKFLESEYFANWHGFLADPRLQELVDTHGCSISFVIHPNMRAYADYFNLPHVRLVRQEEADVQELLKTSAILITDFSSVAWDFAFLDRPVLYFQFDRGLLVNERAPHIDFHSYLPGPIVTTPRALAEELSSAFNRDCRMLPEHRDRARAFLTYRDRANAERIFKVVKNAWTPETVFDRARNSQTVQRAWTRFKKSDSYFRWMQALYNIGRRLPRRNTIMFECDRGAHYGDAPRYLYETLIQQAHKLKIFWSNNTTLRLSDSATTKLRRHSPRYYWELSRARYWINNQNFPSFLAKPKRTKFLQTWHGTPLKRMQHDVPNMLNRDPGYHARAARLTSYWDSLVSASPYATSAFRSAFDFNGDIIEQGYPRNDPFFWPDAKERAALTRSRLGIKNDNRTVVLYAPTFRDDERKGINWKQRIALDIEKLEAELSDDFVVVVRFHQLVRQSITTANLQRDDFLVDASTYPDIQELLLASDVLITDYSSAMFDFAALQRPILFYAYDLAKYRGNLRGFYLDFENVAPGPILETTNEITDSLTSIDRIRSQYSERLRQFAQTYGPNDDGDASVRVLKEFFDSGGRNFG